MRALGRRWYDQIKPWIGWGLAAVAWLLELLDKLPPFPKEP